MKTLFKVILCLLIVLVIGSVGASFYFFNVAQVRGKESFITVKETPQSSPLYQDEKDFLKLDKKTLTLTNDDLTLKS